MLKGFFVTGTDTNVGKTVLSALLCAGLPGDYWKPIQTGTVEGTDREAVISWAGMGEDASFPEAYTFDDPVSPHLAAQRSGSVILLEKIAIPKSRSSRPLIVEGAGGVLVPINSHQFMADLMRHVGFPVVLAARSTLGTINHTLLSLAALRSAGLQVQGVVPIGPPNPENRAAIENYGKTRVVGEIPILKTIDRESLLRVFNQSFVREAFT